MMNRDTLILVAFCLFIVLVGVRMKQRYTEWKEQQTHCPEQQIRIASRKRCWFTIVQVLVLGGLMVYMIPALWKDLMAPGQVDIPNLILRCLIFICTIYIFISGCVSVFYKGDKGRQQE